ncbi:kinase-like domain-containing protein, partial [Dendryphion nanum]
IPLRVIDDVGTGAYAVAESIKINDNLYARKSIALPRYNSRRIKETIQNEVSIIRMLAHPHIVQIYCTYEKRSRFCIVLQPLADCDLEAFLEQPHGYDTHEYRDLMWRWLRCLPSTLAFIHSKGIRHKDIKSRNILVKGGEIIFADFGSSYAMIDEGTSVTDGPSFGHTRLYCAPEVITNNQRRRSADIFSLGCIFTE